MRGSQTKYITRKDICDNAAFEFSLCDSFFCKNSDFEFLDKSNVVCGANSSQTLEDGEATNNEKKRKRKSNKGSFAYVAVPVEAVTDEARNILNGDESRALCKRQRNVNYTIE